MKKSLSQQFTTNQNLMENTNSKLLKDYTKQFVALNAIQWTNEPDNFTTLLEIGQGKINSASQLVWKDSNIDSFCLQVETDDGTMKLARLNDWIVKYDNGSFDVAQIRKGYEIE